MRKIKKKELTTGSNVYEVKLKTGESCLVLDKAYKPVLRMSTCVNPDDGITHAYYRVADGYHICRSTGEGVTFNKLITVGGYLYLAPSYDEAVIKAAHDWYPNANNRSVRTEASNTAADIMKSPIGTVLNRRPTSFCLHPQPNAIRAFPTIEVIRCDRRDILRATGTHKALEFDVIDDLQIKRVFTVKDVVLPDCYDIALREVDASTMHLKFYAYSDEVFKKLCEYLEDHLGELEGDQREIIWYEQERNVVYRLVTI